MNNAVIEKCTYIDSYGVDQPPYFVIKWQINRRFGKPKWVYLRHEEYGYEFYYKTKTKFLSKEHAQLMIDKYLSKGIMIPTTIKEIVK